MDKLSPLELYTSTTERLRAYANALKIAIPEGSSRFDIIDIIRMFQRDTPETDAAIAATSPGEAPSEIPIFPEKYSLRIQRIRDSQS